MGDNKNRFRIEGLSCANCAAQIEEELRTIPQVKDLTVEFATQSMHIELHDGQDIDATMAEAGRIASRIEPGTVFVPHQPLNQERQGRDEHNVRDLPVEIQDIVRLILGGILFVAAIFIPLTALLKRLLFGIAYILIGGDVVLIAVRNILRGKVFDENFLMTVATMGAFAINESAEAVVVMLFYQIGEIFQKIAVHRSRKSISELMDIRPDYANVWRDGSLLRVSPDEVLLGDRICIRPGEKVPLDGVVEDGEGFIDSMALTGESEPARVQKDDRIYSGSINLDGLLTVKVTTRFSESTVAGILNLVENATHKKAPTEQFITKFAKYYTPVVVFVAVLLAIAPPIFIDGEIFSVWLHRALVFLVVSCPCALVISIPLGFFGGIAAASRKGILIKGGQYLEALNKVDTVVFDKTGTVTEGVFEVSQIIPEEPFNQNELVEFASVAESHSSHPIAKSLRKAYPDVSVEGVTEYQDRSGAGVRAIWKGRVILAGNEFLMRSEGVNIPDRSSNGVESTATVLHIAVDGAYAGMITVSDRIKKGVSKTIDDLKKMGVRRTVMLSGDKKSVAESVASAVGIDEVHYELLPAQKVEVLESLQRNIAGSDISRKKNRKIIYVGDGINDAPVIARADIGVAMGALGSDAAIEAADVVLMDDDPEKLVQAIGVAKRTLGVVWQNIAFAMGVKLLVLLLGAGGLSGMWEAVFADVGVALIAILNAARLIRMPGEKYSKRE